MSTWRPRSLQDLAAATPSYRRTWVSGTAWMSFAAYLVLVANSVARRDWADLFGSDLWMLLASVVTLWMVRRGRVIPAATLLATGFALELHASLFLSGIFLVPTLVAFPVLVAAVGTLLGPRAALGIAAISCVTAPLAVELGARRPGFVAEPVGQVSAHVIFVLSQLAIAGLVSLALRTFGRVFQDLAESQKQAAELGRIVEQASSEIYVIDRESGHVIMASRGALANLGFAADELIGTPAEHVSPSLSIASLAQALTHSVGPR